jgi:hypothetical protein
MAMMLEWCLWGLATTVGTAAIAVSVSGLAYIIWAAIWR